MTSPKPDPPAPSQQGNPQPDPTTVVLVDDSALFRNGLASLLQRANFDVVAQLSSPSSLPAVLDADQPDVVIMDIRMPPTHTDEGITCAIRTRSTHPHIGVLILSTYADGAWARTLFANGSAGLGYLLKDRVDDISTLAAAIARVRDQGTVVDPEVVDHLLAVGMRHDTLAELSPREMSVLQLMAEGRSNVGIGQKLFLSARTVEAHIASVFTKLNLAPDDNTNNRRVLAALMYLQAST